MRVFIMIISLMLFASSGLIALKALSIPVKSPVKQSSSVEKGAREASLAEEQLAKEKAESQAKFDALQAEIAKLEDKLSKKDTETEDIAEPPKPVKEEKVLAVLGGGKFNSGQVIVSESLLIAVDKSVNEILSSPGYRVVVEGHTDNIPINTLSGKQYKDNMDLSFLRAKSISQLLIKRGISAEDISVVGYGDTRPIASNETEEGRAKNRRVEIRLVPSIKEFQ